MDEPVEAIRPLTTADRSIEDYTEEEMSAWIQASAVQTIESTPVAHLRRYRRAMYNDYLATLQVVGGLGAEDPDTPPEWFEAAIDRVLARVDAERVE